MLRKDKDIEAVFIFNTHDSEKAERFNSQGWEALKERPSYPILRKYADTVFRTELQMSRRRFTKSIFVQSKVDFLSHEVSSEGMRADPKKTKAVTKIPFPRSKKEMQSFLGALNYYSRFIRDSAVYGAASYQLKDRDFAPGVDLTEAKQSFLTLAWVHKSKTLFRHTTQFAVMQPPWHFIVQRAKERDCLFAQLLQAGLTIFVDLDDSLAQVTPPTKGLPSIRMDPNLLYARLPRYYQGFVLSFDGSAKTEKHGGYDSLTAASVYLEATTVNLAEYAGMNNGVQAALERTTNDLSLWVIACRKESLLTQLIRHRELTVNFRSVKYLHVVRKFDAAADSLASETLESKMFKVMSIEARLSELTALNRIQNVIYEPTTKAETEDKPSVNTNFFEFVRDGTEIGQLTVTTRQQAIVNERRVGFASEASVVDQGEADSQTKSYDMPTKAQNHVQEEQPRTKDSTSTVPSANDIDSLTVLR
ncbi:Hypothetical protein PHPALM_14103 [Phytophthora palmivora]|uniref:Reverse transcriptase n=1 Tax=Phytophthora palmivora TaxID=4796 RepID=A0A2P4XVL0_9STRA|nr:Hypothetical protein PHPALM_14103 [Phytophthora palmivora]